MRVLEAAGPGRTSSLGTVPAHHERPSRQLRQSLRFRGISFHLPQHTCAAKSSAWPVLRGSLNGFHHGGTKPVRLPSRESTQRMCYSRCLDSIRTMIEVRKLQAPSGYPLLSASRPSETVHLTIAVRGRMFPRTHQPAHTFITPSNHSVGSRQHIPKNCLKNT